MPQHQIRRPLLLSRWTEFAWLIYLNVALLGTLGLIVTGHPLVAAAWFLGILVWYTIDQRDRANQLHLLQVGVPIEARVVPRDVFRNAVYVPEVTYFFEDSLGRRHRKTVSLPDRAYEDACRTGYLRVLVDPDAPDRHLPEVLCTAAQR